MARSEILTTYRRIRRQLASGHRGEFGALDSSVDVDDDSVTFDSTPANNLQPGSILAIDLELMRVKQCQGASATVQRGWADSEPASHLAGTEIAVNPRFSLLDISEAATAEVDSWAPNLWRTDTIVVAAADQAQTIELPVEMADMLYVLNVQGFVPGSNLVAGVDDTTAWPAVTWRLDRMGVGNVDAALTTGLLLRLPGWGCAGSVAVKFAVPLTIRDYEPNADLIDDCRLAPSMIDLLEMGVKMRLLSDGEIGRSSRQVQGDNRLAAENPVGSMVPVLQLMQTTYARKMGMEQRRLYARHPIRIGA